jgi:hypothetical protein
MAVATLPEIDGTDFNSLALGKGMKKRKPKDSVLMAWPNTN